jgi:putative DNA-invertase from lambdoid prophage Rac
MARNRRSKPTGKARADSPLLQARCAVYHRVSTLDQDPQLARAELESWVARVGGAVAMRVEESASGAWNGRPGLVSVLEAARRGELDAVVVWKLDRWGRSALDVLANIQALADAGVRFVAVSQGLDIKAGGDAMSRLMLTVLAAVAEFERDLIRERTKLGLDRARRRGVQLGRPREGAVTAEAVKRLRSKGLTWEAVAKKLHCTIGQARVRAGQHHRDKRAGGRDAKGERS